MQGYAQDICRTRFFVGLRIEVDAPGVLAAIRPCLYPSKLFLVDLLFSLHFILQFSHYHFPQFLKQRMVLSAHL